MGIFEQFPYTNFHELNLDWILRALKELEHTIEQFVAINALKYADPIQWNIASQYEKNTIVIDPVTGTAYISVQPVPAGVALTNTDYWTVVFDLGSFVVKAAKNFTSNYEEATTLTATMSLNAGDWVIWGDTLYKALVNITAGDQYVIDSNIKLITVEEIIGHLEDLNTVDNSSIVSAINECVSDITTIISNIGALDDLVTTDKSSIVNAINEEVGDREAADISMQSMIDALVKLANNGLSGYQIDDPVQYMSDFSNWSNNLTGFSMQGACYNKVNNHFVVGFIDEQGNGVIVELQDDLKTVIREHTYINDQIAHCNDITYNALTNEYIIAAYSTGSSYNGIIKLDAATLDYVDTITLQPTAADPNHAVSKIVYDDVNNCYYAMSNRDLFKYDANFDLVDTHPFTIETFNDSALLPAPTATPLQSIDLFDGKIAAIYSYISSTFERLAAIVIYNLDGTVYTSYPLNVALSTMESESISAFDGGLKVIFGSGIGVFSTSFYTQLTPTLGAGVSPYSTGIELSSMDLDDLYNVGCYLVTNPATVANSPFSGVYILYSLNCGPGFLQVAIPTSNRQMIAFRRCNYQGIWPTSGWEYSERNFIVKGKTTTISGETVPASTNSTGNLLNIWLTVPVDANVNSADLSLTALSAYLIIPTGSGSISLSDLTISSITKYANTIQISATKADATSFTTGEQTGFIMISSATITAS